MKKRNLLGAAAPVLVLLALVLAVVSMPPLQPGHLELVGRRPGDLEGEEIYTLRWFGEDKELNVSDYLARGTREWIQEVGNGDTFEVVITEPVTFWRPLQSLRISGSWVVVRWDNTTATLIRNGTIYMVPDSPCSSLRAQKITVTNFRKPIFKGS